MAVIPGKRMWFSRFRTIVQHRYCRGQNFSAPASLTPIQSHEFIGILVALAVITIYTVGHSNHTIEKFLGLLSKAGITAIADVRSRPYSRRHPQFNRETLAGSLKAQGIAYVHVGEELGARSQDPDCYVNGRVQYERLAGSSNFKLGIERVLNGARSYRVALMCAEREPLECHRTLLVSRALERSGVHIEHVLADGSIEPQSQTMARLVASLGLDKADLFADAAARVEEACRLQEARVAYIRER